MRIKSLIFIVFVLFSAFAGPANAVTVSVVPGKSIGLSDSYYWAGIVTLNIDGKEYPAMAAEFMDDPDTITDSWNTTLWSQSDIESGTATALYTPDQYSMASQLFFYAMLGYDPADPLWTAGHNEMVWDVITNPGAWEYGDRVYDAETGLTMHDVYTLTYLAEGLNPDYNYSSFMGVLNYVDDGTRRFPEFLVYTVPAVPIPPAVWLFGSGLFGLAAVTRRRKNL